MKKYSFVLIALLFISSICLAGELTTIEKDSFDVEKISLIDGFEKVEIDGITAFTSKDFEKEEIFIATDKLFYGSKDGQIDLTVYLGSLNPSNYKVAIELENGKRIDVKEYTINSSITTPKSSLTDSFEISSVPLTKAINSITLKVSFDPKEIGFATKFNVVVYDLLGKEVFRLDPFLSGYDERYAINIGSTHTAIPNNYTHVVTGVNMSTWNCNDNNSVAIAFHGTGGVPIEIDAIIDGTCGVSTDATISFMEQTLIPANTGLTASDTNGYYAYSTSSTRASPLRDCTNVYTFCDDFEDGTITGWSKVEGTPDANATTDQAKNGSYSMQGASDTTYNLTMTIGVTDNNIIMWQRTSEIGVNGSLASIGALNCGIGKNRGGFTNKFAIYIGGGTYVAFDGTNPDIQANKWYKYVWQPIDNTHSDVYVLDSDGKTILGHSLNLTHASVSDLIYNVFSKSSGVTYFDDVIKRQGVAVNPVYTIGTKETPQNDFNITFNVYQQTGADFDLNSINIDFNVNAYDQTGVNSPVTINDVNTGDYLVTISKTGWDSNTFVLTVDANKNLTYYLDKYTNPVIAQFEVSGATTVSSRSYQNIGTFSYDTSYGFSLENDVSCSFWITSDNGTEKTASWRIQSSTDAVTWTTRKETERTISANTTGGSIYIATTDFNIVDGTQYFRLQNKLSSSNFDVNTNDVICHNFINIDQNNNIIPTYHDTQTALSTSSTSYELLTSSSITTNPFNSFLYYYGDMVYNQTVTKGTAFIRGDLKSVPDSNSAEYMRTTDAGSSGVGGFAGMFNDLNSNSSYSVQTYGKTTAGTVAFDYYLHLKQLNQRPTRHDQNKHLDSVSFNDTSLIKVASLDLTLTQQADFRALVVLPFSCSVANCDLNTIIQISGNGYDVNSLSHKRTSSATAGDIGVLVNQYLFSDVNSGSISVDLWASTSTGTIDFNGGSFSVIKANETETTIEYPPNPPMIYAPTNQADVNGTVDFNCWSYDPDNDVLTYDVNLIVRDTNATALVLQVAGDGNGDFNSLTLANGTYSFNCSVTDTNFSASFVNDDYNFTIANVVIPSTPSPNTISTLCDIEINVLQKDGIYYFNSNIVDSNGLRSSLKPLLSFFSQKYDLTVFESKSMTEALTGNYVYSKELFLENGQYSYLIYVDGNCSKSFTLKIEDSPELLNYGTLSAIPKPINTTSNFDLWGLINNNILILIFVVLILIGGFLYSKKK